MKIRPEWREEVLARSAAGESYAQIAAWLGSTHQAAVSESAVAKLVARMRTEARDRVKATLVAHVEKSTAPATLKAFRNRELRALRILRKIEDRLLGESPDEVKAPGVGAGLVDSYAKVSAIVIRYGELHRRDLEASGDDTAKRKLDEVWHGILAAMNEGPG